MNHSGKIRDFYIKEALSYIEQNFQNNITIEDIASFCGLNRSYFGKIFHDSIGKSPQEFLISYRMTKRCRASETNLFIHCGYWKCRRISESVTFFKSIQEYLWNFSKKLAH